MTIYKGILDEVLEECLTVCPQLHVSEHQYCLACITILIISNVLYRVPCTVNELKDKTLDVLGRLWECEETLLTNTNIDIERLILVVINVFQLRLVECINKGFDISEVVSDEDYDSFETYVKTLIEGSNHKIVFEEFILKLNGILDMM